MAAEVVGKKQETDRWQEARRQEPLTPASSGTTQGQRRPVSIAGWAGQQVLEVGQRLAMGYDTEAPFGSGQ